MFENSHENILEQINPIVEQNSHLLPRKKIPPKFQITASLTRVSFTIKKNYIYFPTTQINSNNHRTLNTVNINFSIKTLCL